MARRLQHERGSRIARTGDAVIIRRADDLGRLDPERDSIAYGPRQWIECWASPTPIAQTHAPTCMGMAYAPPTERKDAPHSTATTVLGPRVDQRRIIPDVRNWCRRRLYEFEHFPGADPAPWRGSFAECVQRAAQGRREARPTGRRQQSRSAGQLTQNDSRRPHLDLSNPTAL